MYSSLKRFRQNVMIAAPSAIWVIIGDTTPTPTLYNGLLLFDCIETKVLDIQAESSPIA